MTIAIGIMATDGIIMGADSEESTPSLKSSQQKMLPIFLGVNTGNNPDPPAGVVVITGAGDGGYIEAATEELTDVFCDPSLHGRALQRALRERLKVFYRDHVIPFATFPEEDRPAIQLLMGVQKRHGHDLLITDKSTIRSVRPYGTVGIGGYFAKIILDALWKPAPAKEMSLLAVYVLMMVKDHIPHCGKFSSVMTLHHSIVQDNPSGGGSMIVAPPRAMTQMDAKKIFDLEMLFSGEYSERERSALWDFITTHS